MAEYRHQRAVDAPPLRLGRVLTLVVTAAVGFVAGCVLLNVTLTRAHWHPPLPRFAEVVSAVEAQKDQLDLLFFGPSHMMTDIDPRLFDAKAAELGHPTRSYNFSVEGLRVSERDYLLKELQRIHPPKLRYVLVKPDIWLHTDFENAFSTRARYFDDPKNTRRDIGVRMASSKPLFPYRIMTSGLMAIGGLVHLANPGVIADLMLPPKGELKGPPPEGHPERQGYVPLVREHRNFAPLLDSDPYPLDAGASEAPVRELSPAELAVMAELFQGIEQLGATPIVLIPPVGNQNLVETEETLKAMAAHFPEIPVIANNQQLYTQLKYWEDEDHLSVEGARVYSEILAQDFVAVVRKREQAP